MQLTPMFNKFIAGENWNFDIEDCDNILRVDSQQLTAQQVIDFLNAHKYDCVELL